MSGSNEPQSVGDVRKASVRIFASTPNGVVVYRRSDEGTVSQL
jgi:hypothetical protein